MNYLSNFSRSQNDPKVLRTGMTSLDTTDRLARGLGWFSIGLGLAEILAARRIARSLGMEGREAVLRAFGAREALSGILCLSVDKRCGLWSRVAGDGLDITTLSAGLVDDNPKRDNVALALAMVAGITLLDVVAAQSASMEYRPMGRRRNYSDRSGFPQGLAAARSAATKRRTDASRKAAAPSSAAPM